LRSLPYRVIWVDSRDAVFPVEEQIGVQCEHSDPVQAAVAQLPPQSQVLIMSFSHAERPGGGGAMPAPARARRSAFCGVDWQQDQMGQLQQPLAQSRVQRCRLAHITCPIGVPGITGKEPEVIAVAVAAQRVCELMVQ
jgi:xanthine dehydrogenase accessory factor